MSKSCYDCDGDLDMFLLNHSVHQNGTFAPRDNFLGTYNELSGDRMFRNDGNNHFTDVTAQTHVTLTALGYDSATNILDTLTLTQFGAVGTGYIAGSFSGQVTGYVNSNPVLYPIRGRLRVKRTN